MRKTITIGDLGTIITGKTPPTTNKNYYGDYAVFIKPTDISEQSKYTYETEEMYSKLAAEKYESSLIPKGAICVPCIGTIGTKMTMAPCDCYTNQSINSIVCNDNYDNEYVYYLIKNFLPGLKAYNLGTASGREYVSKSNFEKIEIVAEQDKNIQKRIGLILSRYDSLIENYQKQIKLLEEAAQRLYKEWFVELRFPGYESAKIVDGVPEGWENGVLEDIAFESGKKVDKKVRDNYRYYLPIDCLPQKSLTYLSPADISLAESSLVAFAKNDIIFGAMRPYFHKVCFAQSSGLTRSTCFVLNAKDSNYQGFLLMLMFDENTVKHATSISVGTTMPYTRWKELKSMKVLIPNKELAIAFGERIEIIKKQLTKFASQIRLLTEARDRLLPKLMGGEMDDKLENYPAV